MSCCANLGNLVRRARWSSLWQRVQATQVPWLSEWPVTLPAQWLEHVNVVQTESELAALRQSVARGAPYGNEVWQKRTVNALGLQSSLRPEGRPRKAKEKLPENLT